MAKFLSYFKRARQHLGIAFSPACISVAHLCGDTARLSRISLANNGCIDPRSGAVREPNLIARVLWETLEVSPAAFRPGEVSFSLPQMAAYQTHAYLPERFSKASKAQVLADFPIDLPGSSASLVVDISLDKPHVGCERRAMAVAARREVLEGYLTIFNDTEWLINRITTADIALYDYWALQHAELKDTVALLCAVEGDVFNQSLWNRGVLTASSSYDLATGEDPKVISDLLERRVTARIESEMARDKPVEVVILGGELSRMKHLVLRIKEATGVDCLQPNRIPKLRITGLAGDIASRSGLDRALGLALNDVCRGVK